MKRYLVTRVLLFVPTLVVASLIVFVVMRALPGDITAGILGGQGEAINPEVVEALREELGLNDPLHVQYLRWMWSMASGEFGGRSLETRQPIAELVARQLPITLHLTAYSVALALLISAPLGAAAARWQGRWPDLLARLFAVTGSGLPGFWVATLAIWALVVGWRWSPPLSYSHLWQDPLAHFQIMIIPSLVLAWGLCGELTRLTRAGMLEALGSEYVRTARAKGLGEAAVHARHALRMALIPVLTATGNQFGALLGGAVVLESIFGIPGVGRGLVQAVTARDYPVVQSLSFLLVACVLVVNVLVDLLYTRADPRISYDA